MRRRAVHEPGGLMPACEALLRCVPPLGLLKHAWSSTRTGLGLHQLCCAAIRRNPRMQSNRQWLTN